MSKSINVIVVDDHKLVRKGITSLLTNVDGISVIAEAASGEEAILLVAQFKPDVVLMDLQMPGIGGLEATRIILRNYPNTKVMALTVCENEVFPTRLLEEGASGYITKDSAAEEVIRAIRLVCEGKRYISPEIAQKLALKRYSRAGSSPFDTLSEREFQVMLMIAKGEKAQEIAEKLHLSPKTISTYRYRLFDKLGVKSDVELTLLALRYEVIEEP